jgi:phage protein D
MYDIEFLLSRAHVRGYVVVVREHEKKGGKGTEQRLYFGPSLQAGTRDVTFELSWGKSLIEFKPTLTTANQVKSVTVHGWNRSTKKPIAKTVTIDDARLKNNRDLHDFLKRGEPREEIVVNEPVFTEAQAHERALAILSDRQKEMVTATGSTVGLPDLRAGRKLVLSGLGARFSGVYFVSETTHTIGAGGYTTRFTARREDSSPGKSK